MHCDKAECWGAGLIFLLGDENDYAGRTGSSGRYFYLSTDKPAGMKAAVYFGSREIYQDMMPAAKSLIMNSDVEKVFLLIEDDAFPYDLPESGIVQTINISSLVRQIFNENGPNYNSEWTNIGLIRAALTKVFPDLDRILSIDCDTIVREDVSELWDVDLTECYFAGVQEIAFSKAKGIAYINVGVIMINLAEMRASGKDDELIKELNDHYYRFVAQDVMNYRCQGNIRILPNIYNANQFTGFNENEKIIHFAGIRNEWRDYPEVVHYKNIPWGKVLERRADHGDSAD